MSLSYDGFRSLALTAAKQYYDFLTEKFNKGVLSAGTKIVPVFHIAPANVPGEYILTTAEKVTHPDSCQIWITGKFIPEIEILTVRSHSKSLHSVRVADKSGYIKLMAAHPENIQILSDLRFLIRKLADFYATRSFNFTPPAPLPIPPLPTEFTEKLSEEQRNAIESVFTQSVTYISGAPGTGKTKAVLSRCILRYIFAQKCVLLLAPTNNAVEQMLRGILPILRDAGIPLEMVYRLGSASEEFAKEYPQVIGDTATEERLNELLKEKARCQTQLEEANMRERRLSVAFTRLQANRNLHQRVGGQVTLIQELEANLKNIAEELSHSKLLEKERKATYDAAVTHAHNAQTAIKEAERKIEEIEGILRKLRFQFWRKEKRLALESDLQTVRLELIQHKTAYQSAVASQEECYQQWQSVHASYIEISIEHRKLKTSLSDAKHILANLTSQYPQYLTATQTTGAEVYLTALEQEYRAVKAEADALTINAAQTELDAVMQQLENIGGTPKARQKKKALVLAGTIDSSLPELTTEESHQRPTISHVFLDEAGYTSLMKGMAAFACGTPVTFLGDHKQLPPVCEMNRIPEVLAPVCLWALPVAYYTELVYGNFQSLYSNCYIRSAAPSFGSVTYCALNTSFRFGERLAKILARHIYSQKFHGVAKTPFEIQVLDAPFIQGEYSHSNQAEALCISSYLYSHPLENLAVLSPYRDQIKLLRKKLPREFSDNLLTVHRSQGCEWETVIFSVTDQQRSYFTNSNLPVGRSILNTAITRAKRRLVIVCDVTAWRNHPNQLITELINHGTIQR